MHETGVRVLESIKNIRADDQRCQENPPVGMHTPRPSTAGRTPTTGEQSLTQSGATQPSVVTILGGIVVESTPPECLRNGPAVSPISMTAKTAADPLVTYARHTPHLSIHGCYLAPGNSMNRRASAPPTAAQRRQERVGVGVSRTPSPSTTARSARHGSHAATDLAVNTGVEQMPAGVGRQLLRSR